MLQTQNLIMAHLVSAFFLTSESIDICSSFATAPPDHASCATFAVSGRTRVDFCFAALVLSSLTRSARRTISCLPPPDAPTLHPSSSMRPVERWFAHTIVEAAEAEFRETCNDPARRIPARNGSCRARIQRCAPVCRHRTRSNLRSPWEQHRYIYDHHEALVYRSGCSFLSAATRRTCICH